MSDLTQEVAARIAANGANGALARGAAVHARLIAPPYSYNFAWLGRPIIQYPQDMVAMQELIWKVRPDLIIETGIAHGGSLIFSASMLALLDCGASRRDDARSGEVRRKVLGIDIDIRPHNRDGHRGAPAVAASR